MNDKNAGEDKIANHLDAIKLSHENKPINHQDKDFIGKKSDACDKDDIKVFYTINDLDSVALAKIKTDFLNTNRKTLRKHLSILDLVKIRQSFIGRLFLPVKEIETNERYIVETEVGFSMNNIKIPINLAIASEILLSKTVINKGLFRVNTTEQRLRDAKSIIFDLSEQRILENSGKKILEGSFDPIDIAETYKHMLRTFSTSVIPPIFLPIIKKIQNIRDEHEKMCCTKAILYALPPLNRRILENCIYLCYALINRMKNGKATKQQMGIDGMAVVMMPNLFMNYDNNMEIGDILVLVDFSKFLFKNFKELLKVDL